MWYIEHCYLSQLPSENFTKMTGMKKIKNDKPKVGGGMGEEVMAIKFWKLKS